MDRYPQIVIDIEGIRENIGYLKDILEREKIELTGVVKVFSGDIKVGKVLVDSGIKTIGDSRLENLEIYRELECKKLLTRIPMLSQVKRTVELSDISLNSELEVIKSLDKAGKDIEKIHEIILMIEVGDLREGINLGEVDLYLDEILKLKNIKLKGIGTNLTCYGGVIPTPENLNILLELKERIEKKYGIELEIVSGGNSSSLPLIFNKTIPKGINNLRLGESIFFGRETAYGKDIKKINQKIVTLECELIEIREKDSKPRGVTGKNAFGEKLEYSDKGKKVRGILGIGRQDIEVKNLQPQEKNIVVLGGSSDHILVDLGTKEEWKKKKYKVGDILRFDLNYQGLLQLTTSRYVHRKYIGN